MSSQVGGIPARKKKGGNERSLYKEVVLYIAQTNSLQNEDVFRFTRKCLIYCTLHMLGFRAIFP